MAGGLFANAKVRLVASALAGAVLGIIIGWCTNAAMVEISINAIFALYFGFFFLFLAGVITWRVLTFSQAANRTALLVLSGLMGLAGLISIVYQRHWFFSLSAAFRVPIYMVLGIALSFALSFAIAELLNYASSSSGSGSGTVAQRAQSAVVQTPQQIMLLAASSVALGFIYGLVFGAAEIGRGVFTLHTLRNQFIHEERICLPIGALVGALTGFLNEKWSPRSGGGSGSGSGSGSPGSASSGFGAEGGASASSASGGSRRPYSDADDRDNSLDDGDFDPFQSAGKLR